MTHERIKALGDLIAAVEKGQFTYHDVHTTWPSDVWPSMEFAYEGSLDAAKALHEALLPGWVWKLESYDGFSLAWVGPPSEMLLREHETDINNPARAWLIAILKAYRSTLSS